MDARPDHSARVIHGTMNDELFLTYGQPQLGDAARQVVHRHANGCITRSALTPSPNSRPVANEAKFAKAPIGRPSKFFDIHAGNPQSVTRDP